MDLKMRSEGPTGEAHACPTCDETFETGDFLERHIQNIHLSQNLLQSPLHMSILQLQNQPHQNTSSGADATRPFLAHHHSQRSPDSAGAGTNSPSRCKNNSQQQSPTGSQCPYKRPPCDNAGRTKSLLNKHLRRRSNPEKAQESAGQSQTEMPPPPPPRASSYNIFHRNIGGNKLHCGGSRLVFQEGEEDDKEGEEEEEALDLQIKPPVDVKKVVAAFLKDKAKSASSDLA